ncbi:MAG: cupredoxin domain-containing protein [Thermoplasmata archaeon]
MRKATAVAIFIIVLGAAGGSFVWFMEGTNTVGTGLSASYNSTVLIVLYANALGWNYNSSHPDPTIYEKTHVLLEFKVIEQDGLPHTLTINPGPNESASSAIVNVVIPTTIGSVTWVNWSFANPGIYTYWCEVHPETMVGQLVINATTSNATSSLPHFTGAIPLNGIGQNAFAEIFEMSEPNEDS